MYGRPWEVGRVGGPYFKGKGKGKGFGSKGGDFGSDFGAGKGKAPGKVTAGSAGLSGPGPAALQKGQFHLQSAPTLAEPPKIDVIASYSYVAKTPEAIDVFCPAWCVRTLKTGFDEGEIDLSLERSLAALQAEDGGFEVNEALVSALGLESPGSALALAEEEDATAYGAMLALKTVTVYKEGGCSPALLRVCERAENVVFQTWGLEPSSLYQAFTSMDDPSWEFPEKLVQAFRSNFASPGRWSFFELWTKLLPAASLDELRDRGGVLCPRFFLVDLATAPLSPYDADKRFPLIRQQGCIFVGQPPGDDAGNRDVLRQGRQLEAALVTYGWLEEDHLLTELRLPDALAIYSAAPDALEVSDEKSFAQEAPVVAGDESSYEEVGYTRAEVMPAPKHESCRIYRSDIYPEPQADMFVEVKKTTHLNGPPGRFKMLKFWLQAVLAGCGAVVVATTSGSRDGDSVAEVQRYSTAELEKDVGDNVGRVWGILNGMLKHMFDETAAGDGRWTLRLQKPRGPAAMVSITLTQGWEEEGDAGIEQRVADFVESLQEAPIA